MRVLILRVAMVLIAASATGANPSELQKLMKDRPAVAAIISQHQALHDWLGKAFDGQLGSRLIVWRNEYPNTDNSLGKHSAEKEGAVLMVSPRPSPIDQLTIIIYECINARFDPQYLALYDGASRGELRRSDFILQAMQLEHQATLAAQAILRNYVQLAPEEAGRTEAYRKVIGTPAHFGEAMEYYRKNRRKDFDPLEYYGTVYDGLRSIGVMRPAEAPAI